MIRHPRLAAELPAALLALLATVVWLLPLRLAIYDDPISDLPTYRHAADRMIDGLVPYRDFSLEYPPLAAVLFLVSNLLPGSFGVAFSALMLLAMIALVIATVWIARAIGLSTHRQWAAGAVVALSPLVLGRLVETRFDLLVAAIIAWVVYCAVTDRWRAAWVLLGLGVLIKLMPLLLIPVVIIFHLHREGGRQVARRAGEGALITLIGFLPFVVVGGSGVAAMIGYHLDRPLQIESLGAAYLLSLHALADVPLQVQSSFGSQGLIGDGPELIAAITTLALTVLLVVIVLVLSRGLARAHPAFAARLFVAACAATIAAGLIGAKVFSPQFVLWLLPLGLLVSGRYGRVAWVTTVAIVLATGAYFPHSYWSLVALDDLPIAMLFVRDALVIVLLAAAWPRPSIGQPPDSIELPPASTAPQAARAPAARYLSG